MARKHGYTIPVNNHAKVVRAASSSLEAFKEIATLIDHKMSNGLLTNAEVLIFSKAQYQLELLTQALQGQKLRLEHVKIAVRSGIAQVESKSDFVEVVITDYDNGGK